jgi:hypothetical protein
MKQFFQRATMFILLLTIPFIGVELDLRALNQYQWFNGYANQFRNQNADIIFLGSSLMSAAVRQEKFAELISVKDQPPRRAVNLGEGYTTPVEYLFGLRRWAEINPHVFENCTLIMPAAGGLPDARTWFDDWMAWQQPALLASYITYPELWTYCTTLNVPFSEKMLLIASKHCLIIAQGGLLRVAAMHEADLAAEYLFFGGKGSHKKANLVTEGGIVNDEEFMQWMAGVTRKKAKNDLKNQKPIDWDKAVIKDIVHFIKAHGGRVAFCYIPLSTVLQEPLATPTRQADIKNFEKVAAQWGCPILKPSYRPPSDDSYPDLTHLGKDVSFDYTKSLAGVFLADKQLSQSSPGGVENP